jgi:hypothetical protein
VDYQDIITASNAVRDFHFNVSTPLARRLPWTGFKGQNNDARRQAFFNAAYRPPRHSIGGSRRR